MTGGTGFIGSHFIQRLVAEGHHVYVLTRHPKKYKDTEHISYISFRYSMKKLPFIHAVINLAGESLFGFWTEEKKDKIVASRIAVTEKLTNMLMQMKEKPEVFISGSAIGFYGTAEDAIFTENTVRPSEDFLGEVTSKWERAAKVAEDLGVRTVFARFGVVLDKQEGALPQMARPIKLGVGGTIGSGEQWMSWIHINDCVNLLYFILKNDTMTGPVNITAPHPVRNKEFTASLASILKRPNLFTIPTPIIDKVVGEMGQLVTEGQYVLPKKALEQNFIFHYEHVMDALENIYQK